MATIENVVKSPVQGKTGTLKRSSGYEYRDFYYTPAGSKSQVHVVGWHRAIDITTLGTIVAFARGKVVSVIKGITGQTTNPSGGNSVTLLHANGCKSYYCHLDNGSNNHLKVGDIVEEGAKLGTDTIKTTGNSTGLHCHFAIYDPNQTYKDSHYMNPIDYLQGKKTLIGYGETTPAVDKFPGVSDEELARRVWTGEFGNGAERQAALGSRFSAVQALVNKGVGKPTPSPAPQPAPTPAPSTELKVGDKVKIIGYGNGSSYGDSIKAGGIGWERQILKIWTGRKFPYQVGNSTGTTGFYKAEALKKI